jgi:hypothetical protein
MENVDLAIQWLDDAADDLREVRKIVPHDLVLPNHPLSVQSRLTALISEIDKLSVELEAM